MLLHKTEGKETKAGEYRLSYEMVWQYWECSIYDYLESNMEFS